MSTYRRIQHAAHYHFGDGKTGGHDLEQWDVTEADTNGWSPIQGGREHVPADVPADAHFRHGYIDRDGNQHWVFSRTAPLSGEPCARCPK